MIDELDLKQEMESEAYHIIAMLDVVVSDKAFHELVDYLMLFVDSY